MYNKGTRVASHLSWAAPTVCLLQCELENCVMSLSFCNHMLMSGSSPAPHPQCWRAGWTTPESWSLQNRWPVCLSSNTA